SAGWGVSPFPRIMAGMTGKTGQKCVLSGAQRPEVQKAATEKVTKTVKITERKVDKGQRKNRKREKKEGKDAKENNTSGEAPKAGNRVDMKCGAMLTAAGATVDVKLATTTKGGEMAGEVTAEKDEDKRKERGQSEKVNGGNSSGSSKDNIQEKKRGEKELMGEQKGEEEAGVRVKYDVELTVIVSVEGKLSMMDLLLGIQRQCGIIVGCRTKVDGCFEITMKTREGKRVLLDGIRENGILVKARELKLLEWGVEPALPIRRRFLPGEGRERIADGTRTLKVRFNDKMQGVGHFARNCEMGRERRTVEDEPTADGNTGAEGGGQQEGTPNANEAPRGEAGGRRGGAHIG
ncbi:hypothetical protein KUCAC02_019328, partial [Chaenocephalus aceratus]